MLRFVHFSKVCAQHVDDPPPMYCNSFCFVLQYLLKQFVARGSVQLTFFFFFVRINNKKFKRLWVASIFALCSQVTRHDLPCFNFAAAHFKRLSYKTLMQIRDHLKKEKAEKQSEQFSALSQKRPTLINLSKQTKALPRYGKPSMK